MCADEQFEEGSFAVLEVVLAQHPGTLLCDYLHRTATDFCHFDIISKQQL